MGAKPIAIRMISSEERETLNELLSLGITGSHPEPSMSGFNKPTTAKPDENRDTQCITHSAQPTKEESDILVAPSTSEFNVSGTEVMAQQITSTAMKKCIK